jgi:hypothetical protein
VGWQNFFATKKKMNKMPTFDQVCVTCLNIGKVCRKCAKQQAKEEKAKLAEIMEMEAKKAKRAEEKTAKEEKAKLAEAMEMEAKNAKPVAENRVKKEGIKKVTKNDALSSEEAKKRDEKLTDILLAIARNSGPTKKGERRPRVCMCDPVWQAELTSDIKHCVGCGRTTLNDGTVLM